MPGDFSADTRKGKHVWCGYGDELLELGVGCSDFFGEVLMTACPPNTDW